MGDLKEAAAERVSLTKQAVGAFMEGYKEGNELGKAQMDDLIHGKMSSFVDALKQAKEDYSNQGKAGSQNNAEKHDSIQQSKTDFNGEDMEAQADTAGETRVNASNLRQAVSKDDHPHLL